MKRTVESVVPATTDVSRSRAAGIAFSTAIVWLTMLIGLLSLVAAGAGLFWHSAGAAFPFTTLRGETVTIFGQDLYRNDTIFFAGGFRGQDAVVLLFGLPLLALSTWAYRRRSLRGELTGYLLLAGMIILEIMLTPLIIAQTIVQLSMGLTLTTGEIVGPVASFATLGLLAMGVLVAILRRFDG